MAEKLSPKQFIEKMYGTKLPDDIGIDQLRQMLAPKPPRGGGRNRNQPPPPPDEVMQDFAPAPFNRSVGGTRGKYESPAEFDFRMNQGIPRGARRGGGFGLDQMLLMNEGGMSAEDARLKSNIIRSRGGQIIKNDDGKLVQQSIGARRAPTSSTGRAYDPVAERKNLLDTTRAAVAERKQAQAFDQAQLQKYGKDAQVVGSTRGFANKYGTGHGATVLKDDPRPEATVTLGRKNPFTLPMREEIGFMENDLKAEAEFLKNKQSRK